MLKYILKLTTLYCIIDRILHIKSSLSCYCWKSTLYEVTVLDVVGVLLGLAVVSKIYQ